MSENSSIRFPSPSVIDALAVEGVRKQGEAATITGTHAERVKTFVESGNGDRAGLSVYKRLVKMFQNNEIKAKDQFHQLSYYLEKWGEKYLDAGHVGDIDRMSREAAAKDAQVDDADPQETAAQAADRIFNEQNRAAAGEALDLDSLKGEAPAAANEGAAKPKGKGGRKKAAATQAEAAPPAPIDDEVPPAPGGEDFEDDSIRPAFLRQREKDREEEQGGTFSRVH